MLVIRLFLLILLVSCARENGPDMMEMLNDADIPISIDGGVDGALDAGTDSAIDSGTEEDAAIDAGTDAGPMRIVIGPVLLNPEVLNYFQSMEDTYFNTDLSLVDLILRIPVSIDGQEYFDVKVNADDFHSYVQMRSYLSPTESSALNLNAITLSGRPMGAQGQYDFARFVFYKAQDSFHITGMISYNHVLIQVKDGVYSLSSATSDPDTYEQVIRTQDLRLRHAIEIDQVALSLYPNIETALAQNLANAYFADAILSVQVGVGFRLSQINVRQYYILASSEEIANKLSGFQEYFSVLYTGVTDIGHVHVVSGAPIGSLVFTGLGYSSSVCNLTHAYSVISTNNIDMYYLPLHLARVLMYSLGGSGQDCSLLDSSQRHIFCTSFTSHRTFPLLSQVNKDTIDSRIRGESMRACLAY